MSEDKPGADRLTPRNVALSDEAIDWIVRLGSGAATPEDHTAFEEWRARSPAHADAAAEAAALLDTVAHTQTAADYKEIGEALREPVAPSVPVRRMNRRMVLSGGVAAAVAGGVITSGVFGPMSAMMADYSTGVGERREVKLADGSTVWLNTGTALSVDFTDKERRLTLHDGEALFTVAKDSKRPFVVAAGNGEARAVGTIYSVRRRGGPTDVVVTEGIVEVRNGTEIVRLTAGQQLAYGDNLVGAVKLSDSDANTAWVRGKLIFNRRPLREVAGELERYRKGYVIVRGERLKALEVTGVFDLSEPDALLRAISEKANARITHFPLLTIIN